MKNTVVYFGNFSLRRGFASVNRAVGIAHLFSHLDYSTSIYIDDENEEFVGKINSFNDKISIKHKTIGNKLLAYSSSKSYIKIIKSELPQIVVLYDFPFFVAKKIIKHCQKNNIKVLGDFTEWFDLCGYKGTSKILKRIDTKLRMKRLPKLVDGSITVSEYLYKYCESISTKPVIKIYPLMDYVKFELSSLNIEKEKENITFAYVGNAGGGKDLTDEIVNFFSQCSNQKINLYLAGSMNLENNSFTSNVKYFGNVSHQKALEILISTDYQIIYREPKRSNNAGFPSKVAESIMAEVPVITTNFSDIESIIKKDEGYVFDFGKFTLNQILGNVISDINNGRRKKISAETKEIFLSNIYVEEFRTFLNKVKIGGIDYEE